MKRSRTLLWNHVRPSARTLVGLVFVGITISSVIGFQEYLDTNRQILALASHDSLSNVGFVIDFLGVGRGYAVNSPIEFTIRVLVILHPYVNMELVRPNFTLVVNSTVLEIRQYDTRAVMMRGRGRSCEEYGPFSHAVNANSTGVTIAMKAILAAGPYEQTFEQSASMSFSSLKPGTGGDYISDYFC